MLTKLQVAENLILDKKEEFVDDAERENYFKHVYPRQIDEAINIYKKTCNNPSVSNDEKFETMLSFLWYVPDEGIDMLCRWRDMLPFLKNENYDNMISLLERIACSNQVPVHERLLTCSTLYNRGSMSVYDCFKSVADVELLETKDKVEDGDEYKATLLQKAEACRWVFSSETLENKEYAQEIILSLIENVNLPSDERYRIITGYIFSDNRGMKTILNSMKLRIEYDEVFVYALQSTFFNEERNGIRERILSAQHLLGMSCIEETEKNEITEVLLNVARTKTLEENVRGDAADVVLRLGNTKQMIEARHLLKEIGYSSVDTNNANVLSRVRTIYNNSQNVHEVEDCVDRFAEIMTFSELRERPFVEVHAEVSELVKSREMDPETRYNAIKALNRINIDTAVFGKYKVTIAEIFVHVYLKICTYEGDNRALLEKLLIDELVAMGDTCSSGHAARFILVLSAVDNDAINITFEAQVIANIAGRMTSRIAKLGEEERGSVSLGMMDNPDEEDLKIYKEFMNKSKAELYKELYDEFVGGKWIKSEEEFKKYFDEGFKDWAR